MTDRYTLYDLQRVLSEALFMCDNLNLSDDEEREDLSAFFFDLETLVDDISEIIAEADLEET